MSDRWRPSFKPEYKEKLQQFLDDNPELPFDKPKELMEFCTDRFVTDVVTEQQEVEKAKQRLEQLQKELKEI